MELVSIGRRGRRGRGEGRGMGEEGGGGRGFPALFSCHAIYRLQITYVTSTVSESILHALKWISFHNAPPIMS